MSLTRKEFFLFHRETRIDRNAVNVLVEEVEKFPSYEVRKPLQREVDAKIHKLSFTDAAKIKDIERAIDPVPNPAVAPIKEEGIQYLLAQLIFYANQFLSYLNHADTLHQSLCAKIFYEKLVELKNITNEKFDIIMNFICALDERYSFMQVIPFVCNVINEQEEELEFFRDSELFGHNIIYKIAKAISTEKKIYEEVNIRRHKTNEVIRKYKITDIFINKSAEEEPIDRAKGLICTILTPETLPNAASFPEQPVIYIAWAGTHSNATMAMNTERNAGTESYLNFEEQINQKIIAQIEAAYEKYNKNPLEIRIVGHSLGGSLSQLCFHGLLASLVNGIKRDLIYNEEIKREVKDDFVTAFSDIKTQYFRELKEASKFDLRQYKEVYASCTLKPHLISKIHLGVWGDPGVIKPIENSSNRLVALVCQYAEINLAAYFGWGKNDWVSKVGQGRILSDVPNKVAIYTMMTDSGNKLGTLGLVGGVVALAASPFVGGTSLGLFALSSMFVGVGASAKTSYDEHTRKQFETQGRPQDRYLLYRSQSEVDRAIIKKLLTTQHVGIVDKFFETVSKNAEPRYHLEEKKHKAEFQEKLASLPNDNQSIIDFLVVEMNSQSPGKDKCVRYALYFYSGHDNETIRRELLNFQDQQQKTLLHYAIDHANISLAFMLLDMQGVNVNLQDKDGNTPLLLVMKKLNKFINNDELYKLGTQLLNLQADIDKADKTGKSPRSIFQAWKTSGAGGAAQAFCQGLKFKMEFVPAAIYSPMK